MTNVEKAVDHIIHNRLSEIQNMVEKNKISHDTLEPETFEGQHGVICKREAWKDKPARKTLLQIAEFLRRETIVDYFLTKIL